MNVSVPELDTYKVPSQYTVYTPVRSNGICKSSTAKYFRDLPGFGYITVYILYFCSRHLTYSSRLVFFSGRGMNCGRGINRGPDLNWDSRGLARPLTEPAN